ncbi:transaldolase [Sodalinema gerasimenkoae]|uniref:transaldolase n=1 Tax=Sodalinema gerasimenkoae TaxID=2862348 RepID=UPI001357F172|nr:transaldolase [Sodalinema gerasimenkoae]
MSNENLQKLADYGQSIWMDNLNRSAIESGELTSQIDSLNLRGITSNPSIFEKAIIGNQVYDGDIRTGVEAEKSPEQIYESLIFEDIRNACDIFRPIYDETNGKDGYISIEVSPHLARNMKDTLAEARRFNNVVDRPNVMIKIPGTLEGFAAIEQAIADGINVNVTLLFAVEDYKQAAWAYIRGLETRVQNGQPVDNIASVASFFLSRIDSKVDDALDERLEAGADAELINSIKGKVAIANAKIAYQAYEEIFNSDRWQALAEKGASPQRLLWASTSTKNPDYSDVMYVEELVADNTVNTIPPSTLDAFADHGQPQPDTVHRDVKGAYQVIEHLNHPDIQINLDSVMAELIEEGIDKFIQPYESLMSSIEEKTKAVTETPEQVAS